MTAEESHDAFAADLVQRFEELTSWAIANWPHAGYPLLASDFDASRREIASILGEKLNQGAPEKAVAEPAENGPQYVSMNPSPWP